MFILEMICVLVVVVATVMPLINSINHWAVRVFDFPYVQFTLFGLFTFIVSLCFNDYDSPLDFGLLSILSIALLYRLYIIYPYSPIASVKVPADHQSNTSRIKIVSSNVYMYNDNYDGLIRVIKHSQPDVVLLLETSDQWLEGITSYMNQHYPYHLLHPKDNTYGMLFYSKFPLKHSGIRCLVDENIPSIKTIIVLPDGKEVEFYGLHPEPPSPTERKTSIPRDAELILVGRECRRSDKPVIVAGDMNDVAWSHTTRLFIRISGLLDPRMGRGFFNTYHAKYPLLRWPLDHIFLSSDFKVKALERLSNFNSDHFSILVDLVISPSRYAQSNVEYPDESDRDEAMTKLEDASDLK